MSRLRELLRNLRARTAEREVHEQVDAELTYHFDMLVEENIREGMSPDEARDSAKRRFGDYEEIRTQGARMRQSNERARRRATLLETLVTDVKFAFRGLRRNAGFGAVVILTLALGIGANTAIFTVIEAVLLRSPPFPDSDRVVFVHEINRRGGRYAVSPANYLDWREQQSVFDAIAATAGDSPMVTEGGEPQRVAGTRVSADYFRVLGVGPVMGRTFTIAEDGPDEPNLVVVSHRFWTARMGGDADAVGRSVRLDGQPHTVIGVMPKGLSVYERPGPENAEPIEVWRTNPFAYNPPSERGIRRLRVIARLRDDVSAERADSEMKALAARLAEAYPDTNGGFGAGVYPIAEVLTESARGPLLVLFCAVGFILLIASLNVGNLLLARADSRRNAMTLRRALGASRTRIVRQLLAESLILSIAGAALGVGLAQAALPVLLAASPIDFTFSGEAGLNGAILWFTLAVAVFTAVLTGLVPAIGVSSRDLVEELKERGFGKTAGRRSRISMSTVVIGEVALSVILVIGAGLMLGSYLRITAVPLGFETEGRISLSVQLPRTRYASLESEGQGVRLWRVLPEEQAFVQGLRETLRQLPGVESVAVGNSGPSEFGRRELVRPAELPPPTERAEGWYVFFQPVSADWFVALGVPVVRGRTFHAEERADPTDVAVLNEVIAERLWPGQNPIGRAVMLRDGREDRERPFRVIGISGTVRANPLYEAQPAAYVPYGQQAGVYRETQIGSRMRGLFVIRTARELADIASELKQAVWSHDPDLPISIESLTNVLAQPLADRRFYMGMFLAFGTLAVLLAASGVFAVMAYSVSRKTREFGIRIALGARAAELERAELARGLRLTAIGVLIGGIGAVGLTRFIASFLYGVATVDPITYIGAAVLTVSVGLLAAYLPARRASMVDPIDTLRAE